MSVFRMDERAMPTAGLPGDLYLATNCSVAYLVYPNGSLGPLKGWTHLDFADRVDIGDGYFLPRLLMHFFVTGDGSTPSTGSWGSLTIPRNCSIKGWTLLADNIGSCEIDIQKQQGSQDSFVSITGGKLPRLIQQQKLSTLDVSAWNTALVAGDVLQFFLNTISGNLTWINFGIEISFS